MPEAKSFLASVKDEITSAFADQYDALAAITSDEARLADSLKATQRKVWDVVEKQLKQSYLNGKKASDGKPVPEQRKPNPFRKD